MVYAVRPDGTVVAFAATQPGSTSSQYVAQGELQDRLTLVLDGGGAFAGWRYIRANDDKELYDTNGRLLSITSRAGVTQTLTYGGNGRVAAVADNFGRGFTFQWEAAFPWRLTSVTLPDAAQI